MRKLKKPINMARSFEVRHIISHNRETLYNVTLRKYEKYATNFAIRFTAATGKGFVWKNITPGNLDLFVQYLFECGLSPNSVNQYCKKLKAVIGLYAAEIGIDQAYKKILTTPTDDCHFVYINDKEIKLLFSHLSDLEQRPSSIRANGEERAVNHNKRQIEILKQFLVGLYTGARHSDYIRFTWDNVHEEIASDGYPIYVLTYVSLKTGIRADVPISINSPVVEIIKNMPRTFYSTGVFNAELKVICREAGLTRKMRYHIKGADHDEEICEAITSHTARRSFASNYLSNGASVVDVMHFMGHTNTAQTIGYNQSMPKFDSSVINKF